MSANHTGEVVSTDQKTKTYSFNCTIPIPSYLIAFSVGNLTEQQVGKRTSVITEPLNIARDANELS